MALGGGTWKTQSKILPGSYINFVSAARASSLLSQRGIATIALELDWGPDNQVFTISSEEFEKDYLQIFGYEYSHEKLKGLRELFRHARAAHLYKLNSGGSKASCEFGEARYSGERGNALKIVIEENETSSPSTPVYDVATYLDGAMVDQQVGITEASQLIPNDFIIFKADATLSLTAGTPLSLAAHSGPLQMELIRGI